MSAIVGWAETLRGGRRDEGTVARAPEVIERNAALQPHLVDELLDASRVLTGRLRLPPRPVDLRAVIAARARRGAPRDGREAVHVPRPVEASEPIAGAAALLGRAAGRTWWPSRVRPARGPRRARAAGFDSHLVKPVDAEELLRMLRVSGSC